MKAKQSITTLYWGAVSGSPAAVSRNGRFPEEGGRRGDDLIDRMSAKQGDGTVPGDRKDQKGDCPFYAVPCRQKMTGANSNERNFTAIIENPSDNPLQPSRLRSRASSDNASSSEMPTWFCPPIATVLIARGLRVYKTAARRVARSRTPRTLRAIPGRSKAQPGSRGKQVLRGCASKQWQPP